LPQEEEHGAPNCIWSGYGDHKEKKRESESRKLSTFFNVVPTLTTISSLTLARISPQHARSNPSVRSVV